MLTTHRAGLLRMCYDVMAGKGDGFQQILIRTSTSMDCKSPKTSKELSSFDISRVFSEPYLDESVFLLKAMFSKNQSLVFAVPMVRKVVSLSDSKSYSSRIKKSN